MVVFDIILYYWGGDRMETDGSQELTGQPDSRFSEKSSSKGRCCDTELSAGKGLLTIH